MNIQRLIDRIKLHQDYRKAGMILCHNGVVRETSREGRKVIGLKVHVDHEKLDRIVSENKNRPGIVEILIEIAEDKMLSIGDDVMVLVVAGDIRQHVISALDDTLNAIKTIATKKTEYYE